MKDIIFKRTELEDKEIMTKYFDEHPSRSCERTFVNVFLWSRQYPVKWAIVEGAMVFKSEDEGHVAYAFPAGTDEHVKRALDKMKTYSEERGYPFRMYNVTPNHVNRFRKEFEGRWSYESMKKENLEECFQMALKWRKENGCNDDTDKNAEMCVTMNALRLFEELDLKGGILRIDGKIVAFTIGEPICPDTFVVHIEKAYADVPGAYTMINQQFVEHECMDYKYVNREDDAGSEGLRKAKLSYKPVFMVEKGHVHEKEIEK